jgi:squalene synthase HpnC
VSGPLETQSGKHAGTENFPVGSWLIRAELRPHVHAFYNFARTADDIADNPDLAPEEKVRRLARMGAVLQGDSGVDAPAAVAMRASLAATGIGPEHCLDLLRAFTMDATKLRYRDWDDLMVYCRYSASPVGRQVLDLHGESRETWSANDALCNALQVINHLQDCGDDFRTLNRVYVPLTLLAEHGESVECLKAGASSPGLRRTLDRLLQQTEDLLVVARALPRCVVDARLRAETSVIVTLAETLTGMLRRQDPLARRVKLGKAGFAWAGLRGVARAALMRGGRAKLAETVP